MLGTLIQLELFLRCIITLWYTYGALPAAYYYYDASPGAQVYRYAHKSNVQVNLDAETITQRIDLQVSASEKLFKCERAFFCSRSRLVRKYYLSNFPIKQCSTNIRFVFFLTFMKKITALQCRLKSLMSRKLNKLKFSFR